MQNRRILVVAGRVFHIYKHMYADILFNYIYTYDKCLQTSGENTSTTMGNQILAHSSCDDDCLLAPVYMCFSIARIYLFIYLFIYTTYWIKCDLKLNYADAQRRIERECSNGVNVCTCVCVSVCVCLTHCTKRYTFNDMMAARVCGYNLCVCMCGWFTFNASCAPKYHLSNDGI